MEKEIVRQGNESDRPAIEALLADNSMEGEISPHECLIIEIDGRMAGLARLEYEVQDVYIRPVVVASGLQGKGIGRRLVQEISSGLPEVRVVARGEAVGFYRGLGFTPIAWNQIPERYQAECEACPDRDNCRPVHLALVRNDNCSAAS